MLSIIRFPLLTLCFDSFLLVEAYETRGRFMAKVATDRGRVTLLMDAPTTPIRVLGLFSVLSFSISSLACWTARIGWRRNILSSIIIHHYKNLQCQLIGAGVINDGFNVDLFVRDGPVIKLFQSQNKSLHPLESIVVLHWDNFVTDWACVKTKQANKGNKLKRISFFRLDSGNITCCCLTCLSKQILPVKFWLFIYHWALLSQSLD